MLLELFHPQREMQRELLLKTEVLVVLGMGFIRAIRGRFMHFEEMYSAVQFEAAAFHMQFHASLHTNSALSRAIIILYFTISRNTPQCERRAAGAGLC